MGVRQKLYLLLGVCVLGFVCSVIADRTGKYYADKYRTLKALADNAYLELLQARREEKNFLIRHDPSYIDPVLRHADIVKEDITRLSGQDSALGTEIHEALSELAAYRKGFEDLADIERVKGFDENKGLMRDFVYAARDLDDKFKPVTDKEFQLLLLTIRRHEKNWQLRDESGYVDRVAESVKRLQSMVAANTVLTEEQKKRFASVIETYQKSFSAYVEASAASRRIAETMVTSGRALMPHFEKVSQYYAARRSEIETRVNWVQAGVQTALGLVVLGVIVWTIRGITRSLSALGAYSRRIVSGDLDARPDGRFEAEFAALRDDITAMVGHLKVKMREVAEEQAESARQAQAAEAAMHETKRKEEQLAATVGCMQTVAEQAADISRRLSEEARNLSTQTDQAASGVELERRRVDEMATAISQMNATILEIAASASSAAQTAEATRDTAASGAEVVRQSGASMGTVSGIAVELKKDMANLGDEAQSIGEVVSVINDIADQTNLLALNAAIEAARAGDAGRGFAVVADEVRKLAEKTMVATKEVESRIRSIQDAAGRNIKSMDQAVGAVAEADTLAGKSGEAINSIVGHAGTTSNQVLSIATAAEEQSAASEQISRAITEIGRVSQDNVAGVESTSQAARALSAMAEELMELITRLRRDNVCHALPAA